MKSKSYSITGSIETLTSVIRRIALTKLRKRSRRRWASAHRMMIGLSCLRFMLISTSPVTRIRMKMANRRALRFRMSSRWKNLLKLCWRLDAIGILKTKVNRKGSISYIIRISPDSASMRLDLFTLSERSRNPGRRLFASLWMRGPYQTSPADLKRKVSALREMIRR